VSVREGIHYPETMHGFLSQRLADLVTLVMQTDADTFQSRLGPQGIKIWQTVVTSTSTLNYNYGICHLTLSSISFTLFKR
jgi:hypothetical protein